MNDPLVGNVLDGRFQVMARIGEGGMGVVYKARQLPIDRIVALKMLNPELAADQTWVQRFYNEAKACSRLQHPNTIRMYDFGQTSDGRLFMTMEFLDGVDLRGALSQGPLAPARVLRILIQCCASLAEAHAIGIIHRDIKPDNLFLLNLAGQPDYVKLLDFSVAKLLQDNDKLRTQAGVVFGTPQYMSPEQGRGLLLDARADLYALGILAYEMLTGRVPFHDANPMAVVQMHIRAELPPMPQSVPYPVQALVKRATEKDPSRRYQSAGELMQHAQQVLAEIGGGPAPRVPGGPPTPMPVAPSGPGGPPMGGGAPNPADLKTMVAGLEQNAPPGYAQPGARPAQAGGVAAPGQQPYPQQGFPQAAPGYPPQGYPQAAPGYAQPGYPPGGGYPQGYGQGASGYAQGQAAAGAGQAGVPGGYVAASPMQKTMIAGLSPVATPAPAKPGQQELGPQKTVLLQPSDGVVSLSGAAAPAATGASTTFWLISVVLGVGLGAIAFAIYRSVL